MSSKRFGGARVFQLQNTDHIINENDFPAA